LTHPNIVRIYDFEQSEETGAIAMEFVKGQPLNLLKGQQRDLHFEVAQLRPIICQLCDTLSYAHTDAEIVHRDIKPANLMLTEKNQLKIADFGIARNITDSVSRLSIRANDSSGTPGYMGPQQAMGDGAAVADDIYSVGATLYDLLTSRPPFYTGDIPLQILNKVPPSVASRRAELGFIGDQPVPDEWEEVIAACLEKSPNARPSTIAEVKERLGNAPLIDELDSIALTQSPIINRGGPAQGERSAAPLPTRISTRHVSVPSQPEQHGNSDRSEKNSTPLKLGTAPNSNFSPAAAESPVPPTSKGKSKVMLFLVGTFATLAAAAIGIFSAHYLDQMNTAAETTADTIPGNSPTTLLPATPEIDEATAALEQERSQGERDSLLQQITDLQQQTGKMQEASIAKENTLEELRSELAKLQQDFQQVNTCSDCPTATGNQSKKLLSLTMTRHSNHLISNYHSHP
jgi:serine/threonine protein kinase